MCQVLFLMEVIAQTSPLCRGAHTFLGIQNVTNSQIKQDNPWAVCVEGQEEVLWREQGRVLASRVMFGMQWGLPIGWLGRSFLKRRHLS